MFMSITDYHITCSWFHINLVLEHDLGRKFALGLGNI